MTMSWILGYGKGDGNDPSIPTVSCLVILIAGAKPKYDIHKYVLDLAAYRRLAFVLQTESSLV